MMHAIATVSLGTKATVAAAVMALGLVGFVVASSPAANGSESVAESESSKDESTTNYPTRVEAPATVQPVTEANRNRSGCATAYHMRLGSLAQEGCKTYYVDPNKDYPICADKK